MISNAVTPSTRHWARLAASIAEQLPVASAVFDLVAATLSVSRWSDKEAGLAELSRVTAPDAVLVVADVCQTRIGWSQRSRSWLPGELPMLICTGGLRVERIERIEPIRSVASIADAVLIAAWEAPAAPTGPSKQDPGVGDRLGWSAAKSRDYDSTRDDQDGLRGSNQAGVGYCGGAGWPGSVFALGNNYPCGM